MFVRFVVGSDAEDPSWLTGVITEARLLLDAGELDRHEARPLDETFEWFNDHLPCPPFEKKRRSGEWSRDAVSWFRDDAGEPLGRIWDIVALLEEHGVPVRLVKTDQPGTIVYSDRYQVVAETPSRAWRRRRRESRP
jgi:hypothetical protein